MLKKANHSVIILPLVAITLADGSNLARDVIIKPLSNQKLLLLVSQLFQLAYAINLFSTSPSLGACK
ncbi:hypothetical protein BJV78DRAFT_1213129 [Lactifluus subvellereus]|nr:hypothetical protein BJV78DRAFT_1213129 [Lactifluus subvellereus]